MMRVMIIGTTGLLGNAMLRYLSLDNALDVWGTARQKNATEFFAADLHAKIIPGVDAQDLGLIRKLFAKNKPNLVINCIGMVKQRPDANDPLQAITLNSLLPHQLAELCGEYGSRFIQVSTDCVFSGSKGNYTEADVPDATDLYGRTKLLGEVYHPHAITLRTSIIGHELRGHHSLLSWFLAQEKEIQGFTRAIFSGLPTVEFARVIKDYVMPNPSLHGLFHVASEPIDKYSLLKLLAESYKKPVSIKPSDELVIDRSLNADKFREATGYVAPKWPEMVRQMAAFQ